MTNGTPHPQTATDIKPVLQHWKPLSCGKAIGAVKEYEEPLPIQGHNWPIVNCSQALR